MFKLFKRKKELTLGSDYVLRETPQEAIVETAIKITERQRLVLNQLLHGTKNITGIVEALNMDAALSGGTGIEFTYDGIHGVLRRLEDKSAVRRVIIDGEPVWELTQAGRWAASSDV